MELIDFTSLKVAQLRQECKDRGFKGISTYTKKELIFILENGEKPTNRREKVKRGPIINIGGLISVSVAELDMVIKGKVISKDRKFIVYTPLENINETYNSEAEIKIPKKMAIAEKKQKENKPKKVTVADLKKQCKEKGYKGYSKFNKKQLVWMLENDGQIINMII